jgi:ABC-2 type transport system permease protein
MNPVTARAVAMEWRRIRSVRSSWAIAFLAVATSTGLGAAVVLADGDATGPALAADVVNPGQPAPAAVLLGVLGVLTWGHDHRYGTLAPVLGVVPDRLRLSIARIAVASASVAAVAVLAAAGAVLAGVLVSGGDLAGQFTTGPLPRMLLGSVLFGIGCGWLGIGTGALIRSTAGAVAVLFAVPLFVEPLAATLLGHADPQVPLWLPFHAVGQVVIATPPAGGPSATAGAAVFLVPVAAVLLAGVVRFTRSDA